MMTTFGRVYAVWDYFDGVRSGFADYHGVPHYFEALFDEGESDHELRFKLIAVSKQTIALVVEQWEIFRSWERQFHAGEVSEGTHPAAPGQNSRYTELERMIRDTLRDSPATCEVLGAFHARPNQECRPKGSLRELDVEWSEP